MKRILFSFVCLILLGFLSVTELWALKNVCKSCNTMAELTDLTCKKCKKPLNRCLACGALNPVSVDYCTQCGEMLAEMRVLDTIDPELREELRLGQSDRAQAERELAKINNLIEKDPGKLEIYLYRQAKIFRRMSFYSREAQAWKEYLEKFPLSPKRNRINAFYSESLRLWGNLFYEQGEIKSALEKFELAAKTNPMNAEAWMWVGRLKNEAKDIEGSAKAYLSALEARPGDKTAIHFLKTMKKSIPAALLKPIAPKIPPGMQMALEASPTVTLASAPKVVSPTPASAANVVPVATPGKILTASEGSNPEVKTPVVPVPLATAAVVATPSVTASVPVVVPLVPAISSTAVEAPSAYVASDAKEINPVPKSVPASNALEAPSSPAGSMTTETSSTTKPVPVPVASESPAVLASVPVETKSPGTESASSSAVLATESAPADDGIDSESPAQENDESQENTKNSPSSGNSEKPSDGSVVSSGTAGAIATSAAPVPDSAK